MFPCNLPALRQEAYLPRIGKSEYLALSRWLLKLGGRREDPVFTPEPVLAPRNAELRASSPTMDLLGGWGRWGQMRNMATTQRSPQVRESHREVQAAGGQPSLRLGCRSERLQGSAVGIRSQGQGHLHLSGHRPTHTAGPAWGRRIFRASLCTQMLPQRQINQSRRVASDRVILPLSLT